MRYFIFSGLYNFVAGGHAAVQNTASFTAASSFRDMQRVGIIPAIVAVASATIVDIDRFPDFVSHQVFNLPPVSLEAQKIRE